MTSNLFQRIRDHKEGKISGFTKQYGMKTLVWFQPFEDITQAIRREKQMEEWKRSWKIELIEKHNPQWLDLYQQVFDQYQFQPQPVVGVIIEEFIDKLPGDL